MCYIDSFKGCEVIWWEGLLWCVLGTVLVTQSDSRKEERAFALSCTPEEKQSVAARAARDLRVLL